jgi:hypothetical protein
MTATAPDPRHRAVEAIERHLAHEGLAAAAHLARAVVARLEAAGLVVKDATPQRPWGRCEFHELPEPCEGCAGDAKAKRDAGETP